MGGRQRRPEPTRRRALLWGAVALPVTAAAGVAWWRAAPPAPGASGGAAGALGSARARRETRPTLDPARFVGKPRRAHQVARDLPDVLDQLYCYCECDRSVGHKSLLSCYTDGHAPT